MMNNGNFGVINPADREQLHLRAQNENDGALMSVTIYAGDPSFMYDRDKWLASLPVAVRQAIDYLDHKEESESCPLGVQSRYSVTSVRPVPTIGCLSNISPPSRLSMSAYDELSEEWCARPLRWVKPLVGPSLNTTVSQHVWNVVIKYNVLNSSALEIGVEVPVVMKNNHINNGNSKNTSFYTTNTTGVDP